MHLRPYWGKKDWGHCIEELFLAFFWFVVLFHFFSCESWLRNFCWMMDIMCSISDYEEEACCFQIYNLLHSLCSILAQDLWLIMYCLYIQNISVILWTLVAFWWIRDLIVCILYIIFQWQWFFKNLFILLVVGSSTLHCQINNLWFYGCLESNYGDNVDI